MEMDDTQKLKFLSDITCCGSFSDINPGFAMADSILSSYLPELVQNTYIYHSINSVYTLLKEYSVYKDIVNKNIIALGGKTSSGKSSFFNSVYGGNILPVDVVSCSEVPVYVCGGNSDLSYAVNKFDYFFQTDNKGIDTVFTGFDGKRDNTYGHMLSSVLTYASALSLKHSAFVDIPGYSLSPGIVSSSDKPACAGTADRIKYSSVLLWFADIDKKTFAISNDDITFLRQIPDSVPKLIIISKADIYPQKDFPEILEKTRKLLNVRKIKYIDVLAYSEKKPDLYDKYKILAYLDRWDKVPSVLDFVQLFDKILASDNNSEILKEFRDEFIPVIKKISNSIYNVQNVFQTEKTDVFVPVDEIQSERNQKSNNPLKNLDLSKIKISDLPVPNPEKVFRSYNDSQVTDIYYYERYINAVSLTIYEKMQNIQAVFSYSDCSDKYKTEISEIISRNFNVKAEPVVRQDTEETQNQSARQNGRKSGADRSSRAGRASRTARQQPDTSSSDKNNDVKKTNSTDNVFRRDRGASGSLHRRMK